LEELGIDGTKILKLIFKKQVVVGNLIEEKNIFFCFLASIAAIFMKCR